MCIRDSTNVGYARVDKAGIYNILIMEEKQTILAAGAGASTKILLKDPININRPARIYALTKPETRPSVRPGAPRHVHLLLDLYL